ncbi:hypothetical protein CEXT_670301 [Caerostris extrusa]|uniref:Uncharacterized protein n=1 Tax=Caerostris extrusa TaxID=172846 RepID=A0AAV4QEM2_CAEEX|nr:hypothetical protein CEXT_670301 [Caerostris extrusa]
MKSFLTATFLLGLMVSVLAHRPREGVETLIAKFVPACASLDKAMHDKIREFSDSGELTVRNCPREEINDCLVADTEKVQCSLSLPRKNAFNRLLPS